MNLYILSLYMNNIPRHRKKEATSSCTIALILCLLFLIPGYTSAAGAIFPAGQPLLDVTISGSDTLVPGTDTDLVLTVSNRGFDTEEILSEIMVPGAYDRSLALEVRAALQQGTAPITVKGGPFLIGDIPAGEVLPVAFPVHIAENATAGWYTISPDLTYRYVYGTEEEGVDTLRYNYRDNKVSVPVSVRIQERIRPVNLIITTDGVVPGQEGYVTIGFQTAGSGYAKQAYGVLTQSNASPVIPVDGVDFIGDLNPDDITNVSFKVVVVDDTSAAQYPAQFSVRYKDTSDIDQESVPVTIGIPVATGPKFTVPLTPYLFSPGEIRDISVSFTNTGDSEVFDATARVVGNGPVSPVIGTVQLGNIRPGESKDAVFTLAVDSDATIKAYGLATDLKYRNAHHTLILSDQNTLFIQVQQPGIVDILSANPAILITILGVFIIIGYGAYWLKKKKMV